MPWTFSCSLSYLEQKRTLPLWRRRLVSEKEQLAEVGELKGVRRGKIMYYPLSGAGNLLIAKVDDESKSIEFQHIQIQT